MIEFFIAVILYILITFVAIALLCWRDSKTRSAYDNARPIEDRIKEIRQFVAS